MGILTFIFIVMYAFLVWIVLGGYLLMVCTDFPARLKAQMDVERKIYGVKSKRVVMFGLYWYALGLIVWPKVVKKFHH